MLITLISDLLQIENQNLISIFFTFSETLKVAHTCPKFDSPKPQ